MNILRRVDNILNYLIVLIAIVFSIKTITDFYDLARDQGHFSRQWVGGLCLWILLVIIIIGISTICLLYPKRIGNLVRHIDGIRRSLGKLSWIFSAVIVFLPTFFFQRTHWGELFRSPYIHIGFYFVTAFIVGVLVTGEREMLVSPSSFFAGLILSGTAYMLATSFIDVSNSPLSMSWSEGNRLWDYSLLFGRNRYIYPQDQPIPAGIDLGRQFLWGLPFLIPGINIFTVRLWSAIVSTLPYAVFGWIIFRRYHGNPLLWFFIGLWTFIFLKQAAIYTPLVISATLVGLAWSSSMGLAIPLLLLSGCYAYLTRTTWALAPAIWIFTLEYIYPDVHKNPPWKNAVIFSLAAFSGAMLTFTFRIWEEKFAPNNGSILWPLIILGILALIFLGFLFSAPGKKVFSTLWRSVVIRWGSIVLFSLFALAGGSLYVIRNLSAVSNQPLLWVRLLPNPTYPQGILLALLMACLPLIILLSWLVFSRDWPIRGKNLWIIIFPLLGFLLVGIIASVKSGGGSNLHNLDMFLVGLVITSALAWKASHDSFFSTINKQPTWILLLFFLIFFLPAYQDIISIQPGETLSGDKVSNVIARIQDEVENRKNDGEILFMDQRQLLTFNYVKNVTLVPEYEKKIMMDQAMSENEQYFDQYYKDLAEHRFSLIISEPLKVTYPGEKDFDYGFGEENDYWVKWVSGPTLKYYEPLETYTKGRRVQLLIPRGN